MSRVWVRGLPPWCEPRRLLGPGAWTIDGAHAHAELAVHEAADLDARLRGVCIGASPILVEVRPPLPRAAVRAARTTDARRRRDGSRGFDRPGVRLDEEGRFSLTPEALALALGVLAGGCHVVDLGCGAGGNTIGFARAGCTVTAIERHAGRLADARHNAGIYGVDAAITFVLGGLEQVPPCDILFLDPPWGLDWSRTRTALADLPLLAEVLGQPASCRRWSQVWAKVPPSFDTHETEGARVEAAYGTGKGDDRRIKFLVARWVRLRTPT